LHEAVRAAVYPDVLEGRDFAVDAVQREIVARKLIAGMKDLWLLGELYRDHLDLAGIVSVADDACIEE
jgi:hypothetical protein